MTTLSPEELVNEAKDLGASVELVKIVAQIGRLPVPNFVPGELPLCPTLPFAESSAQKPVFVGSFGILSGNPEQLAHAIVEATANYLQDPKILAESFPGPWRSYEGIGHPQFEAGRASPGTRVVKGEGWILALQGAVEPHARKLSCLGIDSVMVIRTRHLDGLSGLILPGGESTTMIHLLGLNDLWEPLRLFAAGRPCLGVCAGAILLAKEVVGPTQASLGLMNIKVKRNAYGRQIESFVGV